MLVLSGGLDTLTTRTDGAIVAEQLGPSACWVKVENTIHVTALADPYGRASGLVREFMRHPRSGRTPWTSCAAASPRSAWSATTCGGLVWSHPATLLGKGNDAGPTGLRLAAVGAAKGRRRHRPVVVPAGVARPRAPRRLVHRRGGHHVKLDLHKIRFVADTLVDGQATWNTGTGQVRA